MQLQSLLLSLLLATAVAAKGHGNKTMSTASECKEIRSLNKLVELASNTTKLDKVTKGNATKIAEIQAKASTASTELKTLQSNTTLMSACAVISAQEAETDKCQETFLLQKFISFAANTTAVSTVTKNNATKAAEIQSKASDAAVKLEQLTSNSTLQAACPAVMQKDECKIMDNLMRVVNVAGNQTKLDMVAKGNTAKEEEIKSMAAMAQTKLTALQGNATLVAACQSLKTEKGEKSGTQAAAATSSSTTTVIKSAAGVLNVARAGGALVSTVVVVVLGIFIL